MPFNLSNEIDENNFVILQPNHTYSMAALLPKGHPNGLPLTQKSTSMQWNYIDYSDNNNYSSKKDAYGDDVGSGGVNTASKIVRSIFHRVTSSYR